MRVLLLAHIQPAVATGRQSARFCVDALSPPNDAAPSSAVYQTVLFRERPDLSSLSPDLIINHLSTDYYTILLNRVFPFSMPYPCV